MDYHSLLGWSHTKLKGQTCPQSRGGCFSKVFTRTGFSCGLQYGHFCDVVLYDFGVGLCALYLHVSCMCCESKHIAFHACVSCMCCESKQIAFHACVSCMCCESKHIAFQACVPCMRFMHVFHACVSCMCLCMCFMHVFHACVSCMCFMQGNYFLPIIMPHHTHYVLLFWKKWWSATTCSCFNYMECHYM